MGLKKIKIVFLTTALLIVLMVFYIGYVINMKADIADSVLRLHIIGADDTVTAQEIKLKVRDRILADFSSVFKETASPDEALKVAKEYKFEIEKTANDELVRLGSGDRASVEIGECRFPTKKYGNIILPQGSYNAINVKIGKASGQNWWCVMYPPLCITDSIITVPDESRQKLKNSLTDEEYRLITERDSFDIKIKFKIAEILGNAF